MKLDYKKKKSYGNFFCFVDKEEENLVDDHTNVMNSRKKRNFHKSKGKSLKQTNKSWQKKNTLMSKRMFFFCCCCWNWTNFSWIKQTHTRYIPELNFFFSQITKIIKIKKPKQNQKKQPKKKKIFTNTVKQCTDLVSTKVGYWMNREWIFGRRCRHREAENLSAKRYDHRKRNTALRLTLCV